MKEQTEFKTGQEIIEDGSNGSALAGFNRRVYGEKYTDAFQHAHERTDSNLTGGWDLASKLIDEGKIFYVHNFHHTHNKSDCKGYAFLYGGFWVCNSCGGKGVDEEWWKIRVSMDGNVWCCIGLGFKDLQESDNYAFGDCRDEAVAEYGKVMVNSKKQEPRKEPDRG